MTTVVSFDASAEYGIWMSIPPSANVPCSESIFSIIVSGFKNKDAVTMEQVSGFVGRLASGERVLIAKNRNMDIAVTRCFLLCFFEQAVMKSCSRPVPCHVLFTVETIK